MGEPINMRHRYLIKRNADRTFVGSTDDLGVALPDGHILVDTIGVDGLGPGIERFLKDRGPDPHPAFWHGRCCAGRADLSRCLRSQDFYA